MDTIETPFTATKTGRLLSLLDQIDEVFATAQTQCELNQMKRQIVREIECRCCAWESMFSETEEPSANVHALADVPGIDQETKEAD